MSLALSLICAAPLVIVGKSILALFGEGFVLGYPAMVIVALGLLARGGRRPLTEPAYDRRPPEPGGNGHGRRGSDQSRTLRDSYPAMGFIGAAIAAAAGFSFEALASVILARRCLRGAISD